MRVDGSLMGIDDKSAALIPEWKRGHFSLLFDGAASPATVLLLDHKKQTIVDLQSEKKRHRPNLNTEVRRYACIFSFILGVLESLSHSLADSVIVLLCCCWSTRWYQGQLCH